MITALAVATLAGCSAAAADVVPGQAPARAAVVTAAPAAQHVVPTSPSTPPVAGAAAKRSIYRGRIHAYGDSVMLGAKYALQHRLHAKVNAQESRQCGTVVSLVRKAYKRGAIKGPVVIHTGTNGTFTGCGLATVVKKVQRRHAVVLVNVELPSRYSWTGTNNRELASIAREWRHVVLLDWHSLASAHRGWLYSDGIHLTPSGRTGYARAVARLLHR